MRLYQRNSPGRKKGFLPANFLLAWRHVWIIRRLPIWNRLRGGRLRRSPSSPACQFPRRVFFPAALTVNFKSGRRESWGEAGEGFLFKGTKSVAKPRRLDREWWEGSLRPKTPDGIGNEKKHLAFSFVRCSRRDCKGVLLWDSEYPCVLRQSPRKGERERETKCYTGIYCDVCVFNRGGIGHFLKTVGKSFLMRPSARIVVLRKLGCL